MSDLYASSPLGASLLTRIKHHALHHSTGDASTGAAEYVARNIQLRESVDKGMVRVQVSQAVVRLKDVIWGLYSIRLPEPCEVTRSDAVSCLWVTPKEWIFITPEGEENAFISALNTALAGETFAATIISDSRTIITVGGEYRRDLLSKGCAVDLYHCSFPRGRCVNTRFAEVGLMIAYHPDSPYLTLYVDRAIAKYIWNWLEDAAQEFI